MKITVFAQIIANQGQSDALFKILKQLVTDTHTEAGCIEYKLHHSLDDENIFWMYEIWQSQAALDEHMASVHFQAFVAQTADLISRADILKATPVSQ
ncbi:antibiotic biosynthesis monooxygenase [Shewanella baltica]|nr:putative quinol monooxygenase [Shewanella baltica]MCS6211578.1 antibiotic biosynthesis monooxygenase [Shewanella baltica]